MTFKALMKGRCTGIPEHTPNLQRKLSAEVCEVGPLLKVGPGGWEGGPEQHVELDGP